LEIKPCGRLATCLLGKIAFATFFALLCSVFTLFLASAMTEFNYPMSHQVLLGRYQHILWQSLAKKSYLLHRFDYGCLIVDRSRKASQSILNSLGHLVCFIEGK